MEKLGAFLQQLGCLFCLLLSPMALTGCGDVQPASNIEPPRPKEMPNRSVETAPKPQSASTPGTDAHEAEEQKQQDEQAARDEKEQERQRDIEYHQNKIDEYRAKQEMLERTKADNASPDIVQREIEQYDRYIAQEQESIRTIQRR